MMSVSSVNQSGPPPEAAMTPVQQPPAEPPKTQTKQDSVIISEKAKDLAAKKAGKAVEEEAKESFASKAREAGQKSSMVS